MKKLLIPLFCILVLSSSTTLAQVSEKLPPIAKEIIKDLEAKKSLPQNLNEIVVVGNKETPQILAKNKEMMLTDVIATIGGLSKTALKDILVIQKIPNHGYMFMVVVNFTMIQQGKTKDLPLQDGDIVVIIDRSKIKLPKTNFWLKEMLLPLKIPPKSV